MRMPVMTALLLVLPLAALAEPLVPVKVTEWKSVYGRIEARDRLPARARVARASWSMASPDRKGAVPDLV